METNRIIFLLIFSLLVFSCREQTKKEQKVNYAPLMDVTSYTGNAVAFFRDSLQYSNNRFGVQLVPVSELDSNIFKQENFDVFKAIKNKPRFTFDIGDEIYKLYVCKQKKKYNHKICNISDKYNSYVKIWISYQNYEDISKARGIKITTDSCSVREIFIGHNGKLNEFKILSPP